MVFINQHLVEWCSTGWTSGSGTGRRCAGAGRLGCSAGRPGSACHSRRLGRCAVADAAAATGTSNVKVRDANGKVIGRYVLFGTKVYANVVDTYLSGPRPDLIMNDEWPCRTVLEWVLHIVCHDLVHVLHLKMCQYPASEENSPFGTHASSYCLTN